MAVEAGFVVSRVAMIASRAAICYGRQPPWRECANTGHWHQAEERTFVTR